MEPDASSTSPNKETVTLKLPSGEMVDTIVPAGMSDGDIRQLMKLKRPDLAGPPAANVAKPAPMETSMLGNLAPQPLPTSPQAGQTQAGLPGFEGSYASGDEGKAAAMTGAGLATGGGLAIASTLPFLGKFAAKHPIVSSIAISEARKIPYVGKFVPPYAEMLPFLRGGEPEPPAPEVPGENGFTPTQNALRSKWQARGGALAPEPIDRSTFQKAPIKGSVVPAQDLPETPMVMQPDPAAQMRQKLGIEPQAEPVSAPSGQPQRKQGFGKGGFGSTAKSTLQRRPTSFIDNNTPAIQDGPPTGTSVPDKDMTPMLQKMLNQVRKIKAKNAAPMAAD